MTPPRQRRKTQRSVAKGRGKNIIGHAVEFGSFSFSLTKIPQSWNLHFGVCCITRIYSEQICLLNTLLCGESHLIGPTAKFNTHPRGTERNFYQPGWALIWGGVALGLPRKTCLPNQAIQANLLPSEPECSYHARHRGGAVPTPWRDVWRLGPGRWCSGRFLGARSVGVSAARRRCRLCMRTQRMGGPRPDYPAISLIRRPRLHRKQLVLDREGGGWVRPPVNLAFLWGRQRLPFLSQKNSVWAAVVRKAPGGRPSGPTGAPRAARPRTAVYATPASCPQGLGGGRRGAGASGKWFTTAHRNTQGVLEFSTISVNI